MFNRIVIAFIGLHIITSAYSQKIISESDSASIAFKNSMNISAAGLAFLQQKQLLKSSINLLNPEVFIESPFGKFYAGSITQFFEFIKYSQLHQFSILFVNSNYNL